MNKIAELKGSSFTLSVLRLFSSDQEAIGDYLSEKVKQAPAFFASAPVVIDISQCENDLCLVSLKRAIIKAGMIPVGVCGCPPSKKGEAKQAELALMTPAQKSTPNNTPLQPAKVITHPVRSGQQIYAKNADLVILNHVSAGAEVIADGSIHIYGKLRGRAIAGASGQQEAKIFCRSLQAELISISGSYWLSDKIDNELYSQEVMIMLQGTNLNITPLAK
ncbi:septum site-determining protein MinC [Thaumasiovibrio sp. DFM-14]|uniref:septum site-determining protein MinC n=1 Tax=Thaumasiovibrio sp. DFM-14 TaxID=3384792 RepID=UPI0039A3A641